MEWNGREKRRSPRIVFPCKIKVFNKKEIFSSHTENISFWGLRVILEEKIAVSTDVHIDIFLTRDKSIKCSGKIKWVKDIGVTAEPNMFETGISFETLSDISRMYIEDLLAIISYKKEIEEDE
ncbi:MAG: PilZ domain-containing protein [Candidatus Omnitrophota bacterium]